LVLLLYFIIPIKYYYILFYLYNITAQFIILSNIEVDQMQKNKKNIV